VRRARGTEAGGRRPGGRESSDHPDEHEQHPDEPQAADHVAGDLEGADDSPLGGPQRDHHAHGVPAKPASGGVSPPLDTTTELGV
jgi:hypothetical protein